jgi:hypothetical protein
VPPARRKQKSGRSGIPNGATRDRQVSKQYRERKHNERRAERLEEVRDQQRRLDARIRAEQAAAAVTEKTEAAPVAVEKPDPHQAELAELRQNMEKRALWSLGEARNLIRQGYSLEGTVRRTGWSPEDLADVEVGVW